MRVWLLLASSNVDSRGRVAIGIGGGRVRMVRIGLGGTTGVTIDTECADTKVTESGISSAGGC